ncbi:50S ribosomal protein L11 methyltransferase [Methylophilus medardicus]|uniref:50S ribosomal protein L11 methyltransferase n=1 Tax=Methylophilus medardicus TaxID=2588534 RepID=UPI0016736EA8|nr:50S ribosomal protein L11 methyltransferase [Methylophilus medardicus]
MHWLLLKIQSTEPQADALSDVLMAHGALSVSIEDAHADTLAEQAIFGEPGDPPPGIWQQNVVTAMLEADADIQTLLANVQAELGLDGLKYQLEQIEEQDWVRATQAQFDPIRVTDDLWIVPSWHQAPNADAINIVLDPGLAFGTGSHPTTHLCLSWLAQLPKPLLATANVLDYGCGSGILAIAAKKLGAQSATGVDIDTQAVIASRDNALNNQVDAIFYDSAEYLHEPFEIVVANILSSALMVLAPVIASSCKSGGKVALSGILDSQQEILLAHYATWFEMDAPIQQDGWVLLTGTRRCP